MYKKILLFVCFYVITYSFDSCFLIETLASWGMCMAHTLLFWVIRCIVGENFHSDLKYSVRHANAFGKVYVVWNERLRLEYWLFLLRVVTVQQRAQHSCMSCEALNSEVRSANAAAIGSKLRKAASSSATFSKPHSLVVSVSIICFFFAISRLFWRQQRDACSYRASCFHRVNTVQLQYIRVHIVYDCIILFYEHTSLMIKPCHVCNFMNKHCRGKLNEFRRKMTIAKKVNDCPTHSWQSLKFLSSSLDGWSQSGL